MCTWNTLILADLMFLQGGGTCGVGGVSIKYVQSNHFSEDVFLEYCQIGRFNAFGGTSVFIFNFSELRKLFRLLRSSIGLLRLKKPRDFLFLTSYTAFLFIS